VITSPRVGGNRGLERAKGGQIGAHHAGEIPRCVLDGQTFGPVEELEDLPLQRELVPV
jgi:hypothetical protein